MSKPLTRAELVEQLKDVLNPWVVTHHHGCCEPVDEDWGPSLSTKEPEELAEAALPPIVRAITDRVRALHYPANRDADRTPICPDCHGKAGTHPCGCWRQYDMLPICGECGQQPTPFEDEDYPCPTVLLCDEIDAEMGVKR